MDSSSVDSSLPKWIKPEKLKAIGKWIAVVSCLVSLLLMLVPFFEKKPAQCNGIQNQCSGYILKFKVFSFYFSTSDSD